MEESKILILGSNGQLGIALAAQYPQAQRADASQLDISNKESVNSYNWSGISTILNAAAYTNVDGAETAEGRIAAWKVNAAAIGYLVEVAQKNSITLVHISTDYVFDGTESMHKEDEPFSPLSVYGASKAAGDISMSTYPKHYLLRTSWVIGEGKNFVRTMLELGKNGVSPKVVADQIGRPTFTTELVRAIDHLLATNALFGTYNVSGGGDPVSWAELTRVIFKQVGYNLTVTDTTTAEYYAAKENAAPRPLNSVFSLEKIKATGFSPRDWNEDLVEYIKKEIA